jgi:maltose/moltooligosaccharide transporter
VGGVGLLLILSGLLQRGGRYDNGFVTILNDFQDMPHTMKQLAWVQFFSWFALFATHPYNCCPINLV